MEPESIEERIALVRSLKRAKAVRCGTDSVGPSELDAFLARVRPAPNNFQATGQRKRPVPAPTPERRAVAVAKVVRFLELGPRTLKEVSQECFSGGAYELARDHRPLIEELIADGTIVTVQARGTGSRGMVTTLYALPPNPTEARR